jgi:uncharacterized protein
MQRLSQHTAILALIIVAAPVLLAQEDRRPSSVNATAEAVVRTAPDRATLSIGVVTQAQTAAAAGEQNATQVQSVLAELRRVLGAKAEIRTTSYSVHPNMRYPRDGGEPRIAGYIARNVVEATIDDLKLIGPVIDAATKAGSNEIQQLQFSLKDEDAARRQALQDATRKARVNAETIASALGLRIVRVLSAGEAQTDVIRPMMADMKSMRMAEAAPTPVEPGNIEVRARVSLVLEVAQ